MRRRNREVNIFNMSLLDILCGALGAFCFMMLALLPSYISAQSASGGGAAGDPDAPSAQAAEQRAKEAEDAANRARAEQSLAYFSLRWDTADDVDLWLKGPSGDFRTVQKDATERPSGAATFIRDAEKGPAVEASWSAGVASPNATWEMYAELHTSTSASPSGVPVRSYIVGRSFDRQGNAIMALYELGRVVLTRPRERVFVGRLTFDAAGQDFDAAGPPAPAESAGAPGRP